MPRSIEALPETTLPAGKTVSSSFTPFTTERRLRVLIAASTWDFDAAQITFGLEQSYNGGQTWQHWVSWTTNPGRRDRLGNLPWFSIPLYAQDTFSVRCFVLLPKAIRLGLTISTVDGTREALSPPQEPHSWSDTDRKNESAGGGSGSVNLSLNSTAAGSFIAGFCTGWSNNNDTSAIAVSDTTNGSYTLSWYIENGMLFCGSSYYKNNAGGNLTLTFDPNGGNDNSLWACVHEFAGGDTASPASGPPTTATGNSSTLATGSMTPADNDVLLLAGGVVDIEGTIGENAGNEGFTLSDELESVWETSSFVFKIISGAPGTPSHSWTASTSAIWCCGIAAFKPASLPCFLWPRKKKLRPGPFAPGIAR